MPRYVNHVYWKDKRCKKRRALKKCASSTSFMSLIPEYNLKRSNSMMPEIKLDSNPYTKEHSKTIGNFFELKSLKSQHPKPTNERPIFTITDDCDTQQNTPPNQQSHMSRSTSLQIENCGNSLFTCDSLFCSQGERIPIVRVSLTMSMMRSDDVESSNLIIKPVHCLNFII